MLIDNNDLLCAKEQRVDGLCNCKTTHTHANTGVVLQVFAEGPQGGFMYAQRSGQGAFVFVQYSIEQPAAGDAALVATVRCADAALLQQAAGIWRDKVGQHTAKL